MPPFPFWFTGTALYLAASFVFAVGVGLIGIKDMIPKKVFFVLLGFAVLLSGEAWRVAAQQEQDSFNQDQELDDISRNIGKIASAARLNPNQSTSDLATEIIKKLPQPNIPTAAAISQQVVQNETNAHLHLYLYINNFTASGSAAITLVGSNPGNAPIEINRIEASSAGMSDDENNVGFQRVLQPGSSDSKFILAPKPRGGAPSLTVEVLYKGVEQGKPLNLLDSCRFNVNKLSPLKLEIDPIECQESPGDKFIQTEESQEKAVIFKIADSPEGTLHFVLPEVKPDGSPNVISFTTASKFFAFNPIRDFAVFVCADDHGPPKILTEKFNENPFLNHNHSIWLEWNDKTGEVSLEIDGKTKTVY